MVERILTRHGSAILKPMGATLRHGVSRFACVDRARRGAVPLHGAVGFLGRPERPIWRAQAENACFARKQVALSDAIVPAPEIEGPGICGMTRPLKVSALDNGSIAVDQTPLTINCPMIPALEAWLNAIVDVRRSGPASGRGSATVKVFGFYSCRGIDNMPEARASPSTPSATRSTSPASTLADGREIDFVRDLEDNRHPGSRFPARRSTRAPANISPPS